jgi:hypothetical protein
MAGRCHTATLSTDQAVQDHLYIEVAPLNPSYLELAGLVHTAPNDMPNLTVMQLIQTDHINVAGEPAQVKIAYGLHLYGLLGRTVEVAYQSGHTQTFSIPDTTIAERRHLLNRLNHQQP